MKRKPEKRENIVELTGRPAVAVVVDDGGNATHDSQAIIEKVKSGSLGKAAVRSTT